MAKITKTQTGYMLDQLQKAADPKQSKLLRQIGDLSTKMKGDCEKAVKDFFTKHPKTALKAVKLPHLDSSDHYVGRRVSYTYAAIVDSVSLHARVEFPPILKKKIDAILAKYNKESAVLTAQLEAVDNEIAAFEAECILGDLSDVRDKFNALLEKLAK